MRTSQSHDFHQTLGEALDGPAHSDALDADLKKELLFAASRGPEALEGLLACLDSVQRHAAFTFLQSEEGNNATARSLGRKSPEEENFHARRAALDAEPVQKPKDVAQEVTARAEAEAKTEAAQPAPAAVEEVALPPVAEAPLEQNDRDNVLAREAHFAKKWEGNELLARALARRRGGGGGGS